MIRKNAGISALIVACLFALATAPTLRADTIIVRGKEPITGVRVKSETFEKVVYIQKGKTKELPSAEVLDIVHDGQPKAMRLGIEYLNLGDNLNAVEQFKTVVAQASASGLPWLPEYANYYLGKANLGAGRFDAGAQALRKMIALKPDSRLVGEATVLLMRCLALSGQVKDGDEVLKKLEAAAKSPAQKLWVLEARLVAAEGLLDNGKPREAADLAKTLESESKTIKAEGADAFRARAMMLEFEAHLAARNRPKAKNVLTELKRLGRGGNSHALAADFCCRTMEILDSSPVESDLWKAVRFTGRTYIENLKAVSELPRTCYLLGLTHLRLSESRSGEKEVAKGYFEELRRRFPETREAFLARDQLKKM